MVKDEPQRLLEQLQDQDWSVRERAAQALGDRAEIPALDELAAALEDSNTAVVGCAAEALVKRGDRAALEPLLRTLTLEEGEAEQVQRVFSEYRNSWLVDACISALRHEDPAIRALAAEVLGYPLQATRAVDALTAALEDECSDVREEARNALKQIERYG